MLPLGTFLLSDTTWTIIQHHCLCRKFCLSNFFVARSKVFLSFLEPWDWLYLTEAYLKPCQTSKMQLYAKIVNCFLLLNTFTKSSTLLKNFEISDSYCLAAILDVHIQFEVNEAKKMYPRFFCIGTLVPMYKRNQSFTIFRQYLRNHLKVKNKTRFLRILSL